MSAVSQFVFFDDFEGTATTESNVFGNANQAGALTLQILTESATTIDDLIVYGGVDMKEPDSFYPIKAVALKNFRTFEKITSPGIYLILTEGVAYIKLVRSGTGTPIKAFAVGCA